MNGSVSVNGDLDIFGGVLDMNQNTVTGVKNPTGSKHATNKEYVDQANSRQSTNIRRNTTQLALKADLTKTDVQTFAGRIQGPDFESHNHNIADVPNLKYVIANYLNIKNGGVMEKPIQFNASNSDDDRQIFGLGTPKYNSSAVNKKYVDDAVASGGGGDTGRFFLTDGSQKMTGNLDMDDFKIINSKDPTDDQDLVTKHYLESSNVESSNTENVFEYVMEDPKTQMSAEDDIEIGDKIGLSTSPHRINKKVIDIKLPLDASKGYYSSRYGINIKDLANSKSGPMSMSLLMRRILMLSVPLKQFIW